MQAFSSMRKADPRTEPPRAHPRRVDASVPALAVAVGVAAVAAEHAFAIEAPYAAAVTAAFVLGAAGVLRLAALRLEGAFGSANRVTLARGALAALAAGLLIAAPGPAVAWFAVTVSAGALVLDGVDGALARRRGLSTAFGARFDMETDALTILILCLLAWHFGRAGAWVLVGGLLRYGFVAAGAACPWLKAPLPRSRRRQAACVVQSTALVVCLAPALPVAAAAAVAGLGLAAVAASFAVDVQWLWRCARRAPARARGPVPADIARPAAIVPPAAVASAAVPPAAAVAEPASGALVP